MDIYDFLDLLSTILIIAAFIVWIISTINWIVYLIKYISQKNKIKHIKNEEERNKMLESAKQTILKKFLISIVISIALSILFLSTIFHIIATTAYKPIIYLYPTEPTELTVKLSNSNLATCVYPEYSKENGWRVLAEPNGDLIDLKTNRKLYSLYYESNNVAPYKIEKDGFVVKGEDTAKFLEEKLEILGLNYKESEEFIVYWLPKLEKNKYNYIRFATLDEINKNMPLEFSKQPDTLIRVLMTFKSLDKPIKVQEQKLETPNRNGFVAVEWGGSEIK